MPGEFARVSRAFFDKGPVAKMLDRKTKRVLARFGAFVRRAAQTSMRPGKKPSAPGEPPRARGTRLLRKLLFFSYDAAKKSVVIGPLRLGRTADQHVPKVLEEGGTIVRRKKGKTESDRYEARPFMKPAFRKEIGWVAEEYRK